MDYDYNTTRKKLTLPEYGRNIQKMVDHIMKIEDGDERNKAARTIINIMGSLNPHLRDISDFKHKLWDHLAIMSDFKLDIDAPYKTPPIEILTEKPRLVPYNTGRIRYKHYGKTIEMMIEAAIDLENEEEKMMLIKIIANHMKKSYVTWNRENVTDDVIISDLRELSKGRINVSTNDFKLSETKELLSKNKRKRVQRRK